MDMGPSSLDLIFDAEPWASTLTFDAGIPVSLSGTVLGLDFDATVDPGTMMGSTFHLFDWTGVTPMFRFRRISSAYQWDTSRLYSDGTVTLIPEPRLIVICGIAAVHFSYSRRRVGKLRT
jgi:hypothetical protein